MINRAFLISTFIFLIFSCTSFNDSDNKETTQAHSSKKSAEAKEKPACICMMIYEPVCDKKTDKTYGNACQAKCEGVKKFKPGACTL
ncbi:MAG: hypothetical protein BM556_11810 [Bacteriovorax sp. MedPE-SWde]|nr:MAG: hypothetical protein BM556_11810 [Bacteriovorax sp. MedPE-SWde]